MNGNIVDANNHVELHEIDEEKASAEDMLLWVKSARRLKNVLRKESVKT